MASSPLFTLRLLAEDDPAMQAVCDIYLASIPESERKLLADFRAMAQRDDYRFLVALTSANIVAGFAAVFIPSAETFCLLEYLAVDSSVRSAGIGSALVSECRRLVLQENPPRAVIVEVESDVPAGEDHADRTRRIRFYERLGYQKIAGLSYLLPLRSSAGEIPPPMGLMVRTVEISRSISCEEIERWLRRIYRDVYGQPSDDPRIAAMLSAAVF